MVNLELLRTTIDKSGISLTFIAEKMNISRESLYNKLSGSTEFKVSEITGLAGILRLSNKKRDNIFFSC